MGAYIIVQHIQECLEVTYVEVFCVPVSRTLSELSTCCKKATYWWMGRSRGEEEKGRDEKEKCNTQLAHSCIGVLKFASCTTMTMSRVMAYGILLMLRCLGVG